MLLFHPIFAFITSKAVALLKFQIEYRFPKSSRRKQVNYPFHLQEVSSQTLSQCATVCIK